jgi:hypothetical protein
MVNGEEKPSLLRELDERMVVKGDTDGFMIDLPINSPITRISFDTYFQHENIPPNTLITVPRRPVSRIILINEGPGDIKYATSSRAPENVHVTSTLRVDEDREIRTPKNTMKALFIQAVKGADVTATHALMRVEITS